MLRNVVDRFLDDEDRKDSTQKLDRRFMPRFHYQGIRIYGEYWAATADPYYVLHSPGARDRCDTYEIMDTLFKKKVLEYCEFC